MSFRTAEGQFRVGSWQGTITLSLLRSFLVEVNIIKIRGNGYATGEWRRWAVGLALGLGFGRARWVGLDAVCLCALRFVGVCALGDRDGDSSLGQGSDRHGIDGIFKRLLLFDGLTFQHSTCSAGGRVRRRRLSRDCDVQSRRPRGEESQAYHFIVRCWGRRQSWLIFVLLEWLRHRHGVVAVLRHCSLGTSQCFKAGVELDYLRRQPSTREASQCQKRRSVVEKGGFGCYDGGMPIPMSVFGEGCRVHSKGGRSCSWPGDFFQDVNRGRGAKGRLETDGIRLESAVLLARNDKTICGWGHAPGASTQHARLFLMSVR